MITTGKTSLTAILPEAIHQLNKLQRTILRLMGEGHSIEAISVITGKKPATIHYHRRQIVLALGMGRKQNRFELAALIGRQYAGELADAGISNN